MSKKRKPKKKKKNSRRPARRPASRSRSRSRTRASSPAGKYAVVRGAKRNPTPMITKLGKGAANRVAKFLRSHFPGKKIRVVSAKTTFSR